MNWYVLLHIHRLRNRRVYILTGKVGIFAVNVWIFHGILWRVLHWVERIVYLISPVLVEVGRIVDAVNVVLRLLWYILSRILPYWVQILWWARWTHLGTIHALIPILTVHPLIYCLLMPIHCLLGVWVHHHLIWLAEWLILGHSMVLVAECLIIWRKFPLSWSILAEKTVYWWSKRVEILWILQILWILEVWMIGTILQSLRTKRIRAMVVLRSLVIWMIGAILWDGKIKRVLFVFSLIRILSIGHVLGIGHVGRLSWPEALRLRS